MTSHTSRGKLLPTPIKYQIFCSESKIMLEIEYSGLYKILSGTVLLYDLPRPILVWP